jgi:hypothetical protein
MVFEVMSRFLLLLFLVCSCQSPSDRRESELSGRLIPDAVYVAEIPEHWVKGAEASRPVRDTKEPIAEWSIEDIRITLHNFPAGPGQPRIPPMAQAERWKSQFDQLEETDMSVSPCNFGGFTGVCRQTTGIKNGAPHAALAWALQISRELVHHLEGNSPAINEMRSDVTIKAVGAPESIRKHQQEIRQFAESFRLKEEIPW